MGRYRVQPILPDHSPRPRPVLATCFVLLGLVGALILGEFRNPVSPPNRVSESYPWLYLRDGEPLAPDEDVVSVIAVGDVMLGRGVADEPEPFSDVKSWLNRADLTLGNLECVVAEGPETRFLRETGFLLRAPSSAVVRLRRAGFDVLGLANNHTLDMGPAGLAETAARLEAAGIAVVGAGPDDEAAFRPVSERIDGLRLALLAFNAVPDPGARGQETGWMRAEWNQARAENAVAAARDASDAVIASIHWGYEYETRADPAQRDAARALLEAGADLIVGHHPHVVQAFEVKDGRCVAYSLGNFVFDQGQGETGQGLALWASFDGEGLRAVQALPVWAGPRPRLMTPEEESSLLTRVKPSPRRLAFACDGETCRRVERPEDAAQTTRSALFWAGEIDLTGDGVPERVHRIDEGVTVYQGDSEVWRSPPDWRVVDVALGDPNDDGRGELLLALWKPGLDGLETPSPERERVPRSRPFIVGYRGGIYRTLWGGSAVSAPIHEIELGDVDGDGAQELIVLEEVGDGSERAITYWRWHGWGFSLVWRSAPGRYRDLVVEDDRTVSALVE